MAWEKALEVGRKVAGAIGGRAKTAVADADSATAVGRVRDRMGINWGTAGDAAPTATMPTVPTAAAPAAAPAEPFAGLQITHVAGRATPAAAAPRVGVR